MAKNKTKKAEKAAAAGATFEAEAKSVLAGEEVVLTGSDFGLETPKGNIYPSVIVDFGDGNTRRVAIMDDAMEIRHAYDKAGTYDVRVLGERVRYDEGPPVLASTKVTVAALGSQN